MPPRPFSFVYFNFYGRKKSDKKLAGFFRYVKIVIAKNMKLPEMYQFEFDDPVRTFMQMKGFFFLTSVLYVLHVIDNKVRFFLSAFSRGRCSM